MVLKSIASSGKVNRPSASASSNKVHNTRRNTALSTLTGTRKFLAEGIHSLRSSLNPPATMLSTVPDVAPDPSKTHPHGQRRYHPIQGNAYGFACVHPLIHPWNPMVKLCGPGLSGPHASRPSSF